jgi:hypothetical protein
MTHLSTLSLSLAEGAEENPRDCLAAGLRDWRATLTNLGRGSGIDQSDAIEALGVELVGGLELQIGSEIAFISHGKMLHR